MKKKKKKRRMRERERREAERVAIETVRVPTEQCEEDCENGSGD
jgi:hypothetical protein